MSLLYATTGQAGGTAFLAVMTFETFPPSQMRPTALLLNVVAAGYSTWRQHRRGAIEWDLMIPITVQSLVTAFLGGQLVVRGPFQFSSQNRFCGKVALTNKSSAPKMLPPGEYKDAEING